MHVLEVCFQRRNDSSVRKWGGRALLGPGAAALRRCSPGSALRSPRSILGMHLFGCKFASERDGDTLPDRKNFDSLLWAIVTVFQVLSIEQPDLLPCGAVGGGAAAARLGGALVAEALKYGW